MAQHVGPGGEMPFLDHLEELRWRILYSLIALGFVLIFKASGVFNFAQGIMVVFAALTLVGFHEKGVPALLALVLAIGVMLVLAIAVERVVLRPLDRGETAPLERVFAGLSLRSRRMRFLTGMPSLGPTVLHGLADVDQDRHGCWVASVGSDPVAIGRYATTRNDPAVAEIALEVVDRYQSHGLGGLLVDVVAAAAADVGVTTLRWLMDETNLRVRHLAVSLQGRFRLEHGVIEGTTRLPLVPELDAAQIVRCARVARRRLAEQVAA